MVAELRHAAEEGRGLSLDRDAARVLLLVSLEGETAGDITDCLEERGHEVNTGALRRALKALAAAGLLETFKRTTGVRGPASTAYRLATGAAVEEALDLAYQMTSGGPVSPS